MRIPAITGIERAIRAMGTQTALALAIGVRQSRIHSWMTAGYVPETRAELVASVTGVPIADLLRTTPRRRKFNGKVTL